VGTVSIATRLIGRVTHKTAIDSDAERELLFEDLRTAGKIVNFEKIRLENPTVIESFLHDRIFTHGFAYFVRVP
jgi:hypothetical protein